jgi:manganese-dependent inorganic pyrophosphatase
MSQVYVIGHVNPDTDAIASAMGYAWLLRERDGAEAIAARAGPLNPQTTWAIQRLGLESPALLTDASPRFGAVAHRMDTTSPESPLREAWDIASRTGGVAPVVNPDGSPFGLLTGLSLFNYLSLSVGPHPRRQEMRISEILEVPCREASDTGVPKFQASSRIRDGLHRILREERNEFWVVDEKGHYAGICRQRELLNPPRLRLILVDHNEPRQSLGFLEEAELIEVLDHHRLDNPSTHTPIRFTIDVVGSTSTLVSEQIEEVGLSAPPSLAGLLLAGLLSDTLILKSPTTTPRDHQAADRLGRWALVGGGPLEGESVESFGRQLLQAGVGLSSRDPEDIVGSDLKVYEADGRRFAIAQVEVSDPLQIEEHLPDLYQATRALQESRGLDFAMLMVTDVVGGSSSLILSDPPPELDDLPYRRESEKLMLAEGVVSRKKQLLPVVLSLLEN